MFRYLKYLIIFITFLVFQVFFVGNIGWYFPLNLLLLFFIYSFFVLPLWVLIIFSVLTALVYGSVSFLPGGINFLNFFIIFILGWILSHILEVKSFWAKGVIGEIMLIFYFVLLAFESFFWFHLNLWLLISKLFLFHSFIYLLGLMILNYRFLYEIFQQHH